MPHALRLTALTSCAALAGCAALSQIGARTPMPVSCNADRPCNVAVSVEQWPKQCLVTCDLVVAHEVIVQDAQKRWTQPIVWELPADSLARFADDGIVFAREDGFTCRHDGSTGDDGAAHRFVCTGNGKPGRYEYTVHVKWGLLSLRRDPWVVNR